jgi:integrase
MTSVRLTKRSIDDILPNGSEFTVWDTDLTGFGLRVRENGVKSYVVVYRSGHGRKAPVRRLTIGRVGKVTPDEARTLARKAIGSIAHGYDPAADKAKARSAISVNELADLFLAEHVQPKRKQATYLSYRATLNKYVRVNLGTLPAEKLTSARVAELHLRLQDLPSAANRTVAVLHSMFSFAQKRGYVAEVSSNPASRIEKYRETSRERYLTVEELLRLGEALREAETTGIGWIAKPAAVRSKHSSRPENQRTIFSCYAIAALRLLLLTGCRLREILNLRWEYIDFERGMIFLPDSKTGRKPIILNGAAVLILKQLPRFGDFVLPGDAGDRPRHDLKRVWTAVSRQANLSGVRIHDLRHTFASYGAGSGLSLPIIGKLLGHSQPATTQRYAHLDVDPLRRASDQIGATISDALEGIVANQERTPRLASYEDETT